MLSFDFHATVAAAVALFLSRNNKCSHFLYSSFDGSHLLIDLGTGSTVAVGKIRQQAGSTELGKN